MYSRTCYGKRKTWAAWNSKVRLLSSALPWGNGFVLVLGVTSHFSVCLVTVHWVGSCLLSTVDLLYGCCGAPCQQCALVPQGCSCGRSSPGSSSAGAVLGHTSSPSVRTRGGQHVRKRQPEEGKGGPKWNNSSSYLCLGLQVNDFVYSASGCKAVVSQGLNVLFWEMNPYLNGG